MAPPTIPLDPALSGPGFNVLNDMAAVRQVLMGAAESGPVVILDVRTANE